MAFDKLTDPSVNEGNLTLDELNQRIQAFQKLSQTPGSLNRDQIQIAIGKALQGSGYNTNITPEGKGELPGQIADWVMQEGRYPDAREMQSLFARTGGNPVLQNFSNDQDIRNNLSQQINDWTKKPDTTNDISRIQGLIDSKTQSNQNQNDLNSYTSNLPDALKSQENQMLGAYDQSQGQQFQDVLAPQMLESANSRGALFSGDVGDMLSSGAGNIQAGRESLQSQIQNQDLQFYFNAQYNNTLNQQLQGQSNYAQFLQGEQNRVLQQNSNQFQTNQANLTNTNQQNIQGMQYQSQIRAMQKQLQMQQDYQNQQRQSNLIGGIGQTAGGLAMTGIGAYSRNPFLISSGIGMTAGGVGGISQGVGGH